MRIGYPSRASDLDAYPGFQTPPEGYGEVAFYWWVGERLDKERLEWQLDQMKDHHITALQINYAHGDEGGHSYGLTYPSEPPLFSEEWWALFAWFAEKAGEYGIWVSLSDYTLCTPGQGWYSDELLAKHPDTAGAVLKYSEWIVEDGSFSWALPANTLSAIAVRMEDGKPLEVERLNSYIQGERLQWNKPEGNWRISVVSHERVPMSIDPTHPRCGELVIEHFFQRFEDRLSSIPGARLGFFFSDELDFGLRGKLWSERIRQHFIARKGYDPIPELAALFTDIGPRTPKVRLDYNDAMVELSELHYFRPVFDWHEHRGLIYGCDHGGRGRNPVEFGDYFRTQRWNQGPGCDQPNMECDLIKNKVASSIAHMYERPRTWLEGFYGSGWGTTTEALTDAIFRNFVSGHNLLTLHGLYYTTNGGWWEWAPPCNHFRMPYWPHMKSLMACTERLSYVLSQGSHVCDVAVVYPVASLEAGLDGERAVAVAFGAAESLYKKGIDFDFIDHQSLERAETKDGELSVAGESFKVLILPSMRALRRTTLRKAFNFYQSGGIVIAIGDLPEASDSIGANDPGLDAEVRLLFGWTAAEAKADGGSRAQRNAAGGRALTARTWTEAVQLIEEAFPRDFICAGQVDAAEQFPYVQHRRIGSRDLYAVYNVPRGTECFFRCYGSVERWNPWDGTTEPLQVDRVTSEGTWIRMPSDREELALVVFSPGAAEPRDGTDAQDASVASVQTSITLLDGKWLFELRPTMDNRFGDFRQPPSDETIGAEARFLRFAWEKDAAEAWQEPGIDDSEWQVKTVGYGPFFWKLGPLPYEQCSEAQEQQWAEMPTSPSFTAEPMSNRWDPYDYSTRYGIEGDPGHQGYHGLKGKVSDEFIAVGRCSATLTGTKHEPEEEDGVYYLWSTVYADEAQEANLRLGGFLPDRIWLNGGRIETMEQRVSMLAGSNRLLLRYRGAGRAYVVFTAAHKSDRGTASHPLSMAWYDDNGVMPYDAFPERRGAVGWYRFTAPPGLAALEVTAHGKIEVWADGIECEVDAVACGAEGATIYRAKLLKPCIELSAVAIRLMPDKTYYAGAAIPEPIKLQCAEGIVTLGDWSLIDGLTCYSGEAIYRKRLIWNPEEPSERVLLQLGEVAGSAQVAVNGHPVRILLHSPWEVDIGGYLHAGENLIEVSVRNTLANHYATIPTRYRGRLESGLMGPVQLAVVNIKL
ncbi:hypothetical protein H8B09_00405 [Paenibacillus sp. PR3]|uniref:Glycosyl hydrolases family 2 sugar binding domain-containing protein n=1 Tax=Paenibacillus terricola TaxID=2763503 RepID=A0ABR8MQN2_9BACL|nr:glycosyl hydrolase [Paenibacillus terricola]MBD3917197.1 hypothetical protein [Paenibacillus terricola]